MKFGVFADLHYADKENDTERFFQNAPEKLKRCIQFFQKEKVDFMICLGDLLDIGKGKAGQKQRLMELYKIIGDSEIPFYLCLGNHDIDALPCQEILAAFLPGQERGYYSFDRGRFHFTVLDTNYDAAGKHYQEETMKWDRLYVSEEQLDWLLEDLKGIEKQTIILTHGNLDERTWNGEMDPHVVKNQEAVRKILQENGQVLAVLQGHCHAGAFSVEKGIPYLTLKALVDGREKTPILLGTTEGQEEGMLLKFLDLAEGEQKVESCIFLR